MTTPTANSVPVTRVTPPDDPLVAALLVGGKWGGAVGSGTALSYSFPAADDHHAEPYSRADEWQGFSALSAGEQADAERALAAWAAVADLSFTRVAESEDAVGDIRFAQTTVLGNSIGRAYYPSGNPSGGDVWLDPGYFGFEAIPYGYPQYKGLLHEAGHALGLKHGFDDFDGTAAVLPTELDSYHYSVMSYFALPGAQVAASIFPTTPMLLDIAALQHLYGANTEWRTGPDVYTYDADGRYLETIWDAGGIDSLVYRGEQGGVINLTAGSFSQLGQPIRYGNGQTSLDTVAIAHGVVIENASGGNGADRLIGNAADNVLAGGLGIDTLTGGGGNDVFLFQTAAETGDLIQDFTPGSDAIGLGFGDPAALAFDDASDGLYLGETLVATLAGVSTFDPAGVVMV